MILFRKPYIKRIHVIIEAVAYVFLIATFIVAAIAVTRMDASNFITSFRGGGKDRYGSPMVLFFTPAIILGTNLLISIFVHFGSENMYNTGFKPRPERKYIVLADFTMMVMLIELELSIYALLTTIAWIMQSGGVILALSYALTFPLLITVAVLYVIALKHNKE